MAVSFNNLVGLVADECTKADLRYGPFTSTHEALGVLLEEVDELRDAVRANSLQATRREALQVAAVALRLARECGEEGRAYDTPFGQRSVK